MTAHYSGLTRRGALLLPLAAALPSRARAASPPPITDAAGRVAMTVSVGVAQVESDVSVDALVARADEALQRAKREGRNRVCLASEPTGPSAEQVPASTPATLSV